MGIFTKKKKLEELSIKQLYGINPKELYKLAVQHNPDMKKEIKTEYNRMKEYSFSPSFRAGFITKYLAKFMSS